MSRGFLDRLLGRGERRGTTTAYVAPTVPTSDDLLAPCPGSRRWSPRVPSPRPSPPAYAASTASSATPSPGWPRLGAGSPQAYSVMATATDYLPEAVGGYLRLPRHFADNRPVDRGKSSLMVLIDQLDLLASTMDKVFDAVCRDDAAALVAHGRFLRRSSGPPRRAGASTSARLRPADARPRPGATDGQRMPVGSRLQPPGRARPDEPVERAVDPPAPSPSARRSTRSWPLAPAAGADAGRAPRGGLALAAAVAESAPGAARDWAKRPWPGTTQDFFDAASRGRRWRDAPTATLSSLAAQGSPHAIGVRRRRSPRSPPPPACSASRPCG